MSEVAYCPSVGYEIEDYDARPAAARRVYRCDECGGRIAAGEVHERVTGRDEDWEPVLYRTCRPCLIGPVAFVQRNCRNFVHGCVLGHLEEVEYDGLLVTAYARGMARRWLEQARARRAA